MKKTYRRLVAALIVCVLGGLCLFPVFAQQPEPRQNVFTLHPITDPVIAAVGLGMLLPALLVPPATPKYLPLPLDKNSLNGFDRLAVRPYSKALDITGDILMVASIAVPAVLFAAPQNEWLTIGVMYAESVLFTYALNDLVKTLVPRGRPYLYFDNPPQKELDSGDAYRSFFSRHTSLAFTGAAFASYVFSEYYPDSLWKIPVISGAYALAAATAITRVAGGSHFMTDVITGAVVGTISGLCIPLLHKVELYKKSTPPDGTSLSSVRLSMPGAGLACRLEF